MFRLGFFIHLVFVIAPLFAAQRCWWHLEQPGRITSKKLQNLIEDPEDSRSNFTTHTDFHLKILGRIAGEPARVLAEADKVFSDSSKVQQGIAATLFADLLVTHAIHENAWAALAYGHGDAKAVSGVSHVIGELFPEIHEVASLASFPERQSPHQVEAPKPGTARGVLYERMRRDFKKLLSLAQSGDKEAADYLRSKSAITLVEEYHKFLFDEPEKQFPAYLKIAQEPPVKAQLKSALRFMAKEHGLVSSRKTLTGRLLLLYRKQRAKNIPADEALDLLTDEGAFNPGIHRNAEVIELISELSKEGEDKLALNVARNYTLGPKELSPEVFQKVISTAKKNLEALANGPNDWAFEQADVHEFFQKPTTAAKLKDLAKTMRELQGLSGDNSIPVDDTNVIQRAKHDGPILDVASYMSSRLVVETSYLRDWLSHDERISFYLLLLKKAQAARQPEAAELFYRLSGEN